MSLELITIHRPKRRSQTKINKIKRSHILKDDTKTWCGQPMGTLFIAEENRRLCGNCERNLHADKYRGVLY